MANAWEKKSMGLITIAMVCTLVCLGFQLDAALAANNVSLEELQRKIEEQQRMLEAQQAMIKELSEQMQALKQAGGNNPAKSEETNNAANDTRVEVFGKAIVTSDDPRFRIKINGQVNRQIAYANDGDTKKFYHTDNDNSPTRLNVEASGKVNDDLTVAARIETGYQDNRPLNVNQNNENSGFDFTSRWLEASVTSERFGKLGIGKGFASSFYFNETDLSGTQVVSLLSPGNLFGGLLFYSNDTDSLTSTRVADVFVDVENLSIVNRVRYDSPQFYGFQISGSAGSDQRNDVALRWKDEIGDFQFSGASAYQVNSFGGLADWRVDAALSSLHKPSGLNLSGGAFRAESKQDGRHIDGFGVKAGWRKKWFNFGETALSADFIRNYDTSSDDEKGTSFSGFVVQNIEPWGMQLYAGYRYYDLDRDDLDTEAIHVPVFGTRKMF